MLPNLAPAMRVVIVTPAPRGSQSGNRKTALRWAGLLRQLGIQVRVVTRWQGEACDLMLAVHVVKTAASALACAAANPKVRIAMLLAGTDVYPVFRADPPVLAALQRADALIALQPRAIEALPADLRPKARTIVQSATAAKGVARSDRFTACVLAHLRPVKDPLLPFLALEHVAPTIPIELVVAGGALDPELADRARAAAARDPRCRWIGEIPRRAARALLGRSHVCIVPSTAEGGANVVSEAIAAATPVLATAIPGNIGLLGHDWPALFAPGDAQQLGALLQRAAADSSFYQQLVDRTRALQHVVAPAREREALRQLVADLFPR